jgi:hypothetical protein
MILCEFDGLEELCVVKCPCVILEMRVLRPPEPDGRRFFFQPAEAGEQRRLD